MSTNNHSNTLVPKRSRAGRPMLQDRLTTGDPVVVRKERFRLAQRTYRNRKNSTLAASESRAERLEEAFTNTLKSFTKFHSLATQSSQLTPDMALALSRTAMEISSSALEARLGNDKRLDDLGRSPKNGEESVDIQTQTESSSEYASFVSQLLKRTQFPTHQSAGQSSNPWHLARTPSCIPTFAQLFWLACAERGRKILSSPDTSFSDIHPKLSLQLRWMTVQDLQTLTEHSLEGRSIPVVSKPKPSTLAVVVPDMYRSIEGHHDVRIPRVNGERLVFGRTRTLVHSELPGFEGEFLEAQDLQEYLELMGILNGGSSHKDIWVPASTLEALVIKFDRGQSFVRTFLNLPKLITQLAGSAICVGTGAGVRKVDIDRALIDSIHIVSSN